MHSDIRSIMSQIRDEFLQPHSKPWLIGFSGGKDSVILAHLVVETLLSISPDERHTRNVLVVCNDTLVESPLFQKHVDRTLVSMQDGFDALRLPVRVVKTLPEPKDTFWFNMLGKGYPAPNPSFRWCVDRLKIRPTKTFLKNATTESGESLLLLGVRKAESATRAKRIERFSRSNNYSRLVPHDDIPGCSIFRPIMDLATEEVWSFLRTSSAPWGGDYTSLETLYQEANAGDWPFILDSGTAPSLGPILARFGCWTCTVVEKDRTMVNLIDAGHTDLEPLRAFRDRLREISSTPTYRSKTKRDGRHGLGPLTFEAREMLLGELTLLSMETGLNLISSEEIRLIKEQWVQDELAASIRDITPATQLFTCKNNWTCAECTCKHLA